MVSAGDMFGLAIIPINESRYVKLSSLREMVNLLLSSIYRSQSSTWQSPSLPSPA
jgi:hypothetical protein